MRLSIRVSCKGKSGTKNFEVGENEEIVFGRSNEELETIDPRLSRTHFSVALRNSQIEVKHLSRTNPTLMATENDSEFSTVSGVRTSVGFCRVIAGTHKFLIEFVESPTLSGGSTSSSEEIESWIIEPQDMPAAHSPDISDDLIRTDLRNGPAKKGRQMPTQEQPIPDFDSAHVAPKPEKTRSKPRRVVPRTAEPRSPVPDSPPVPKPVSEQKTEPRPQPKPKPTPKPEPRRTPPKKADDKMNFPIDDDFFD